MPGAEENKQQGQRAASSQQNATISPSEGNPREQNQSGLPLNDSYIKAIELHILGRDWLRVGRVAV